MDVIIQKQYQIAGLPGTVSLAEDDIINAVAPYPATVSFDDETAFLHFDSPVAAADFVNSLEGQVPYKVEGMTNEEQIIFDDPTIRQITKDNREPQLTVADKRARHWGIAAFSVACSAAGIAIGAFVMAIIALVQL